MEEIIKNIERKYKDYKRKFNKDKDYFYEDLNKIENHLMDYKNKMEENDEMIYKTYYIRYKIKQTIFKDIDNNKDFNKERYKKIINEEINNLIKKNKNIITLKKYKIRDGIHQSINEYIIKELN